METEQQFYNRYQLAVQKYLSGQPMTYAEQAMVAYGYTSGAHGQRVDPDSPPPLDPIPEH